MYLARIHITACRVDISFFKSRGKCISVLGSLGAQKCLPIEQLTLATYMYDSHIINSWESYRFYEIQMYFATYDPHTDVHVIHIWFLIPVYENHIYMYFSTWLKLLPGSNGKEFQFLLKGHEDLRQDERVMQLFGLVNSLLVENPETFRRNLT